MVPPLSRLYMVKARCELGWTFVVADQERRGRQGPSPLSNFSRRFRLMFLGKNDSLTVDSLLLLCLFSDLTAKESLLVFLVNF